MDYLIPVMGGPRDTHNQSTCAPPHTYTPAKKPISNGAYKSTSQMMRVSLLSVTPQLLPSATRVKT